MSVAGWRPTPKRWGAPCHCRDAATYHAVAGNVDETFEGLEVDWRQRDAFLTHITRDTVFEPYFGDPRVKSLLARMNLAI